MSFNKIWSITCKKPMERKLKYTEAGQMSVENPQVCWVQCSPIKIWCVWVHCYSNNQSFQTLILLWHAEFRDLCWVSVPVGKAGQVTWEQKNTDKLWTFTRLKTIFHLTNGNIRWYFIAQVNCVKCLMNLSIRSCDWARNRYKFPCSIYLEIRAENAYASL